MVLLNKFRLEMMNYFIGSLYAALKKKRINDFGKGRKTLYAIKSRWKGNHKEPI